MNHLLVIFLFTTVTTCTPSVTGIKKEDELHKTQIIYRTGKQLNSNENDEHFNKLKTRMFEKRLAESSFKFVPPQVDLQFLHMNINDLSIGTTIIPEFSNIASLLGGVILHRAVGEGNLNLVENLIDTGANLNIEDINDMTPLYIALKMNQTDAAKILIDGGAKFHNFSSTGNSMLHVAVANKDHDVLVKLIKLGLDTDATNNEGVPALYKAAEKSDQKMITSLIRGKANINFRCKAGETLLHIGVKRGRIDVVKQLAQLGAQIDTYNREGVTPLYTAMLLNNPGMIQILLDNKAKANCTNLNGESLLHKAVIEGNIRVAQKLIVSGAQPNAFDANNQTALCLAIKLDKLDVLKALIKSRVNINSQCNGNNDYPLHVAVSGGSLESLRVLITSNAEGMVLNNDGLTPLVLAIFLNKPDHIDLLYKAFPIVNYVFGKLSNTPLHLAVLNRDLLSAEKLLKRGARVDTLNGEGLSPLCKAVQNTDRNMIELLLKHDANIDLKTAFGDTPLHFAISNGTIAGVVTLLEMNAALNVTNRSGFTPLCKAIEMNSINNINALLVKGADVNANCSGVSPLDLAVSNSTLKTFRRLINLGANFNQSDHNKHIERTVKSNNAELLNYLLKTFGENKTVEDYNNLLLLAASDGEYAVVREVLNFGALVDYIGEKGYNALWLATLNNKPRSMQVLLNKGADVNSNVTLLRDNIAFPGSTPLHEAAFAGNLEEARILIKHHANINAQDSMGWTPLHYAAFHHNDKVIKELVQSGANIKLKTKIGELPVNLLKRRNNYKLSSLKWLTSGKVAAPNH